MNTRHTVSKQTLIDKVFLGIRKNEWTILHNWSSGTRKTAIEPLVKYLKKMGIEVNE